MSDPFVIAKTWQFNVNQARAAGGTQLKDCQVILKMIVDSMRGFALSPWVVRLSSTNGLAGAGYLWGSFTDVVWASGVNPHSWVMLTNANGWEILFDCNSVGPAALSVTFNPTAAWNDTGSINAAPTPTAGKAYKFKTDTWFTKGLVAVGGMTHAMMTTDGQCTRIACYADGSLCASMLFETLTDVVTGAIPWALPVVCYIGNNDSNHFTITGFTSIPGIFTRYNDVSYAGQATSECSLVGPVPVPHLAAGVPNDISGGYGGCRMGFASTVYGFRGCHGRFQDMWLGSTAITDGDMYPAAPVLYQFTQLKHMITPWNSAAALLKV